MIDEYADRWALITGASSGIGAAFAHRLAARGMHLVLTARREEPMQELAEELDTRHGTRVHIVPMDLSIRGNATRLAEEIQQLDVDIELLVNNAGFGLVSDIDTVDVQRINEMLDLNIVTLTELTNRYAKDMVSRGHGAIINVSSVAAFQPVAYMAAYAASKSYVLHFSEALWAEARDHGVTVMALCPGVTRTGFFDTAGVPNWLKKRSSQDPDQVVRAALKGLEKKRQYYVSGWKNYLLSLAVRLASRRTVVVESRKYFRPKSRSQDSSE